MLVSNFLKTYQYLVHQVVKVIGMLNYSLIWTIEHTMKILDSSMQYFARHGLHQTYSTENERKGDNIYTNTVSNDWSVLV